MTPSPTGLKHTPTASFQSAGDDSSITALSSAVTMTAGFGLIAIGATHLNPAAILPGVPMAVEGTVSLVTLVAGGTPKDVIQIREGFKFSATSIVETGVMKTIEYFASAMSTDKEGKQFADNLGAVKNVAKVITGKPDSDASVEVIRDAVDFAKFLDERMRQIAEQTKESSMTSATRASQPSKSGELGRDKEKDAAPQVSESARPGGQRFVPNY